MHNLDPIAAQQYVDKADHFFRAMKLVAGDLSPYRTGIALLAVHSAISLNDAITAGISGKKRNYEDHMTAVAELESISRKLRIDATGIRHFRWLIAEKSKIAYGRQRLDDAVVRMAVDRPKGFTPGLTIISRRSFMLRQTLSRDQQASRVKNAVAQFLFGALIVPKIFFDARWPPRKGRIDVLAVDRSGAGEIHVVEVKVGSANPADAAQSLMEIPAHFKYLALFGNSSYRPSDRMLYAPDGMGRIGLIRVQEDRSGNLFSELLVRPERFRLDSSYFKQMDKFTATRSPDMEIRP